jgi:hypothetical protein
LTDADLQQALPFRDGEYYIQTAKQELPLAYKNNQYDALEFENNSFQYVRFEKQLTIDKKEIICFWFNLQFSLLRKEKSSILNKRYRCSSLQIDVVK